MFLMFFHQILVACIVRNIYRVATIFVDQIRYVNLHLTFYI
nr:MAG TPA: hypothetical protein [Caudoviricetes sp.]